MGECGCYNVKWKKSSYKNYTYNMILIWIVERKERKGRREGERRREREKDG